MVGTILLIALAFVISTLLGFRGVAAVVASCAFAPTSLGIAMNFLRKSNLVNTPVGQLIVAAVIIDDMVARKSNRTTAPKSNSCINSGYLVSASSFRW